MLIAMLLVTGPVTAALFRPFALAVVPSTLLTVYCFWNLGRKVRSTSALAGYVFLAGGIAGWLNCACSTSALMLVRGAFSSMSFASLFGLLVGFVGAAYGVAYGALLLPPLWIERRFARLARPEALDLCLVLSSIWGLCVLALAWPFFEKWSVPSDQGVPMLISWPGEGLVGAYRFAALAATTVLLLIGVRRLRTRRRWLRQVEQGKVEGWRICDARHFDTRRLDELALFMHPLQPARVAAPPGRVLLKVRSGNGYRDDPFEPAYLLHDTTRHCR